MITFTHVQLKEGAITLAIEIEGDIIDYAAAFCSPKEQFNRRKGRKIAEGRLMKGKSWSFKIEQPDTREGFYNYVKDKTFMHFLHTIESEPTIAPQWLRKHFD